MGEIIEAIYVYPVISAKKDQRGTWHLEFAQARTRYEFGCEERDYNSLRSCVVLNEGIKENVEIVDRGTDYLVVDTRTGAPLYRVEAAW